MASECAMAVLTTGARVPERRVASNCSVTHHRHRRRLHHPSKRHEKARRAHSVPSLLYSTMTRSPSHPIVSLGKLRAASIHIHVMIMSCTSTYRCTTGASTDGTSRVSYHTLHTSLHRHANKQVAWHIGGHHHPRLRAPCLPEACSPRLR